MIIFGNNMNFKNFVGVIDNDKNKQGKYLYRTNLKAYPPSMINKCVE